jgi:hypothetical protein
MGWLVGAWLALLLSGGLAWGQARPAPPPADQAAAPNRPGWSVDARGGCWLWNPNPQPGESVTWSGACDAIGRATGAGVVEWRLGDKIDRGEGEFREGKRHGHAAFTFANGNRYVGEFRDDKFDGRGVLTFAGGARYEGEWREGRPNGQGVYRRPDGNRFVGAWRDGCLRVGPRSVAVGRPLAECP